MTRTFEALRQEMVATQLVRRGIRDERVLDAVSRIPRELFLAPEYAAEAYNDAPAPIGFDQTISQPYITAFMCESLELTGSEVVLDVGTGSGYHAAVLGALARQVYSIERIPALADTAVQNLTNAGLNGNVIVIVGDGSKGYPEAMPYDAISVAAGAPEIPRSLEQQLADGGRLVIPVGSYGEQDLILLTRQGSETRTRRLTGCRFVPLVGAEGWSENR